MIINVSHIEQWDKARRSESLRLVYTEGRHGEHHTDLRGLAVGWDFELERALLKRRLCMASDMLQNTDLLSGIQRKKQTDRNFWEPWTTAMWEKECRSDNVSRTLPEEYLQNMNNEPVKPDCFSS
jgi:hypothetical protein